MKVHTATRDLPTRCAECGARIDHGDRYVIEPVAGGFDYKHDDCTKTAFKGHLERKAT